MVVVCPKCDVALILLEFSGVEVDYCPRCEGLWLDSGEIEYILERTGGNPGDVLYEFVEAKGRSESGRKAHLCPRCDRAMNEIVRRDADGSELIIDRCPAYDGLWFDKFELQMLLHTLPDTMSAQGAIALLSDVLGAYIVDDEEMKEEV